MSAEEDGRKTTRDDFEEREIADVAILKKKNLNCFEVSYLILSEV